MESELKILQLCAFPHTVLKRKRHKFCFKELQLKYFFHVLFMSYIY